MHASFKDFMTGLIDYAGLFPPADLDIGTALGNYADNLEGNHSWMLGRFIIPATELDTVVLGPGFRFSVIVTPAVSQQEFDQLCNFKGLVGMVETRFPENADTPERCSDHLLQLQSRLGKVGMQDLLVFTEAERVVPAAQAITTFNNSGVTGKVIKKVGYKLRCGGLIKKSFPTAERVAEAISGCCDHDIPIKFTAGMHHPLRNHSPEIGVMQHGFINIFGAALLCWSGNLSKSEIVECLCDENAHNFQFTNDNFSWREKTISAAEIRILRKSRVISFGSCSFSEPVEGLNSLGFYGNRGA